MGKIKIGNIKGPQGDPGKQGDKGDAATVMVGTVTTVQPGEPATVENVGTVNNAVLNFQLPKGDDGQTDLLSAGTGDTNYRLPSVPGNAVIRGIYGKTEQVQTQGYQMLNAVPFQSANFNVKENGYVLNLKSTTNASYYNIRFKVLTLSDYWKGKKLTIAIDGATLNNKGQNQIAMQYFNANTYLKDAPEGYINNKTGAEHTTITLPDVFPDGADSICVTLFSAASIAGNTASNCTYYGLRVYEGDYDPAKVWEPYSGGFPSPRVSERTRNLFDYTKISTKSQGGATVTNNNDGTFTISGSGVTTEQFIHTVSLSHDESVKLITAGKYRGIYTKTRPYAFFAFMNSSGMIGELNNAGQINNEISITQDEIDDNDFYVNIGFYTGSGSTITPGTILPFIYKVDDSETEPPKPVPYYTGDWSQPLNDAGGDNGLKLLSESKNRLTNETRKAAGTVTTSNGVTFTELPDGGILVNGTATDGNATYIISTQYHYNNLVMERGKSYKLYGCPKGGTADKYFIHVWNYNGVSTATDYGEGSPTFNYDIDKTDAGNVAIIVKQGVTVNNLIFRPMILEADIDATEYYPYVKTEANFSPLPGLKVEEESKLEYATYIDNSGQAWIADSVELIKAGGYYIDSNNSIVTVDKDTWVRWHRTMTAEFDGSDDEGWVASATTISTYRNYTMKYSSKIIKQIDNSVIGAIVSDSYITVPAGANGTYTGRIGISIEATTNRLFVHDPNYNTNDISLWKAHLSEKPLKCLFALAKPYAEPLAPTEALSLMSYPDVTYISGDNEVNPEIEIDVPKRTEGAYLLGGYVSGVKAAAQAEAVNTALINIQSQML